LPSAYWERATDLYQHIATSLPHLQLLTRWSNNIQLLYGFRVWMAWSKHGFRPIRARVIYMLFYNGTFTDVVKSLTLGGKGGLVLIFWPSFGKHFDQLFKGWLH
jgi:hypothetical protein